MQFIFGAGSFYGVPLTDGSGNAITNPTPVKLLTMQEMSLEFSTDIKELHGQYQFAVDVARGKGKVSGKVKNATINGRAMNALYFGQTMTAGTALKVKEDLTGQVIPATPYEITVTPPSSGTFVQDLGVRDANGVEFVRVASSPSTGQYSVAAGVYTFAAADAAQTVFIDYTYSATLAAAKKITVNNSIMGAAPLIQCFMQTTYRGKDCLVKLHSAMFSKINPIATKLDDYTMPEMDMAGFANAAGQIAEIYTAE